MRAPNVIIKRKKGIFLSHMIFHVNCVSLLCSIIRKGRREWLQTWQSDQITLSVWLVKSNNTEWAREKDKKRRKVERNQEKNIKLITSLRPFKGPSRPVLSWHHPVISSLRTENAAALTGIRRPFLAPSRHFLRAFPSFPWRSARDKSLASF